MRTYYIAQGALLIALWWPEWEEKKEKTKAGGNICIDMADCKATILQLKKKQKMKS